MQKGESLKKYYTSPESPYNYEKESSSSSSSSISKISPLILLVIIVLALIFFVYGIVHLVLWFLMKTPSSSSPYQSSHRLTTTTDPTRGARALQRQLHHLFRLHDSGLQQSLIDTLPLFFYEDVVLMGSISKEPFDCAVCLCEFSHHDKLRLLPMCSHAFHIDCIDTWLLSNSTCPLCRTTVSSSSSGLSMENPLFSVENSWGLNRDEENANGVSDSGEDQNGVKRVFSVRLGKFRNINGGVDDVEEEGSSNTNREARRCYSMGSYQYVVSGSDLQVVLLSEIAEKKNEEEDVGRKRMIGERSRRESFSVSKIWLWSNKTKFHCSSTAAADFP